MPTFPKYRHWLWSCGLSLSAAGMLISGSVSAALLVQDESAYAVFNVASFSHTSSPATDEPAGGNNAYLYAVGGTPTTQYTWAPGLNGKYLVSISWGASPGHSTDVDIFFDSDGYGTGGGEVPSVQNLNYVQLADQSTVGSGSWSGFYTLGIFDLTPDSEFRANAASDYLTAAVWSFDGPIVPEPSSLALVSLGMVLLGRIRSRVHQAV